MSDYFWLREAQFERIKPYLLSHGVPRVDDQRAGSRIIHAIRNGLGMAGCSGGLWACTGPCTIGSYVGSRMGVFVHISSNLVADDEPPDCLIIDSAHLEAHRPAASLQKGEMLLGVSGARKVG